MTAQGSQIPRVLLFMAHLYFSVLVDPLHQSVLFIETVNALRETVTTEIEVGEIAYVAVVRGFKTCPSAAFITGNKMSSCVSVSHLQIGHL